MFGKLFYIVISFGLVINFFGDLSVYHQNRIEKETGLWVQQSYELLHALDSLKIEIFASQVALQPSAGLQDALQNLQQTSQEFAGPELRGLTDAIQNQSPSDLIALDNDRVLAILTTATTIQKNQLDKHIRADQASNDSSLYNIFVANVFDLLLILVGIIFFISERRNSLKMQNGMSMALKHVGIVNQSLQKKMSRKDRRFKMTVHDLKNPLGSIQGFAQLLQEETGHNLTTLEMVQIIKRISSNTLHLVESVLDMPEDDEEPFIEDLRIFDCLKETCQFLEPIARSKRQTISIESCASDFTLRVPKHKMQDVFYNIISNALKYSPSQSHIKVICFADESHCSIEVKDQGPGFAGDDFSQLFKPGTTLSARPTDGEHSSGIGLYSVKNTIDSLKGLVLVKNNEGGGASVTVQLPPRRGAWGE
ncbi:MAG: HAMP domain-containing histidine kinase [Chitinophagaceae bacterium]|nr:HAMP domain-containing histidine kinase [Oligoflexus sp.]